MKKLLALLLCAVLIVPAAVSLADDAVPIKSPATCLPRLTGTKTWSSAKLRRS